MKIKIELTDKEVEEAIRRYIVNKGLVPKGGSIERIYTALKEIWIKKD